MPPKAAKEEAPTPVGIHWFYVKHGAAQKTLFNSNCWVATLMDMIKEAAAVAPDSVCDLQDAETGALLGMNKQEPRTEAHTLIRPTKSYVLVKPLTSDDNPGVVTSVETLYTPPEGEALPPAPAAPTAKKK
jgi:hypothetical protein